jgi:hypothetical protein
LDGKRGKQWADEWARNGLPSITRSILELCSAPSMLFAPLRPCVPQGLRALTALCAQFDVGSYVMLDIALSAIGLFSLPRVNRWEYCEVIFAVLPDTDSRTRSTHMEQTSDRRPIPHDR